MKIQNGMRTMLRLLAAGLVTAAACGQIQASNRPRFGVVHSDGYTLLKPDLAAVDLFTAVVKFHKHSADLAMIGTVKNVGQAASPAGRWVRIAKIKNGHTVTLVKQQVPYLAAGMTFTISTPANGLSEDAKYRLVISAGDDNPANDMFVPSDVPIDPPK